MKGLQPGMPIVWRGVIPATPEIGVSEPRAFALIDETLGPAGPHQYHVRVAFQGRIREATIKRNFLHAPTVQDGLFATREVATNHAGQVLARGLARMRVAR